MKCVVLMIVFVVVSSAYPYSHLARMRGRRVTNPRQIYSNQEMLLRRGSNEEDRFKPGRRHHALERHNTLNARTKAKSFIVGGHHQSNQGPGNEKMGSSPNQTAPHVGGLGNSTGVVPDRKILSNPNTNPHFASVNQSHGNDVAKSSVLPSMTQHSVPRSRTSLYLPDSSDSDDPVKQGSTSRIPEHHNKVQPDSRSLLAQQPLPPSSNGVLPRSNSYGSEVWGLQFSSQQNMVPGRSDPTANHQQMSAKHIAGVQQQLGQGPGTGESNPLHQASVFGSNQHSNGPSFPYFSSHPNNQLYQNMPPVARQYYGQQGLYSHYGPVRQPFFNQMGQNAYQPFMPEQRAFPNGAATQGQNGFASAPIFNNAVPSPNDDVEEAAKSISAERATNVAVESPKVPILGPSGSMTAPKQAGDLTPSTSENSIEVNTNLQSISESKAEVNSLQVNPDRRYLPQIPDKANVISGHQNPSAYLNNAVAGNNQQPPYLSSQQPSHFGNQQASYFSNQLPSYLGNQQASYLGHNFNQAPQHSVSSPSFSDPNNQPETSNQHLFLRPSKVDQEQNFHSPGNTASVINLGGQHRAPINRDVFPSNAETKGTPEEEEIEDAEEGESPSANCVGVTCPELNAHCVNSTIMGCCSVCTTLGCPCQGYQRYDCISNGFRDGLVPEGESYSVDMGSTVCSCPAGGGAILCSFQDPANPSNGARPELLCPSSPPYCIETYTRPDSCVECVAVGCVDKKGDKHAAGSRFRDPPCSTCYCPDGGGELLCLVDQACEESTSNKDEPHHTSLAFESTIRVMRDPLAAEANLYGQHVPQPNLNVPQPNLNVPQPNLNVPQPKLNVPQPNIHVQQPHLNVAQSTPNVPQPNLNSAETNQNVLETNQNVVETKQHVAQANQHVSDPYQYGPRDVEDGYDTRYLQPDWNSFGQSNVDPATSQQNTGQQVIESNVFVGQGANPNGLPTHHVYGNNFQSSYQHPFPYQPQHTYNEDSNQGSELPSRVYPQSDPAVRRDSLSPDSNLNVNNVAAENEAENVTSPSSSVDQQNNLLNSLTGEQRVIHPNLQYPSGKNPSLSQGIFPFLQQNYNPQNVLPNFSHHSNPSDNSFWPALLPNVQNPNLFGPDQINPNSFQNQGYPQLFQPNRYISGHPSMENKQTFLSTNFGPSNNYSSFSPSMEGLTQDILYEINNRSIESNQSLSFENVLSACCHQGAEWAEEHDSCLNIPITVSSYGQICAVAQEKCCREAVGQRQCDAGVLTARRMLACDVNTGSSCGGNTLKACCDCCALGLKAYSLSLTCDMNILGEPCNSAYTKCCVEGRITDDMTSSSTSSTTNPSLPGIQEKIATCATHNNCPHRCVDTESGIECECLDGFELEEDGKTCSDVNECVLGTHDCVEGQFCLNLLGSFNCQRLISCGTGYELTERNTCEDIDECLLGLHNCGKKLSCVNIRGSFRCVPKLCAEGYFTDATGGCIDIDECRAGDFTCPSRAHCENTIGSYTCLCPNGMNFDPQQVACEDIDECMTSPCSRGSTCINTVGSYECVDPPKLTCSPGFEPNLNHTECIASCMNVTMCKTQSTSPRFEPTLQNIDECVQGTHTCSQGSTCINDVGSFRCEDPIVCQPGTRPSSNQRSCVDVDECEEGMADCGVGGVCINTHGSYHCDCQRGYERSSVDDSCQDINECLLPSGSDCQYQCENTPGGYQCVCPQGYTTHRYGKTCQDIDECSLNRDNCTSTETCFNTRGSYRCVELDCPEHYAKLVNRRCLRQPCRKAKDKRTCIKLPRQISYHNVSLLSNAPKDKTIFRLGVTIFQPSDRYYFLLTDGNADGAFRVSKKKQKKRLTGVVSTTRRLHGPRDYTLDLTLKLYRKRRWATYISRIFVYVSSFEF